jgi:SAM-dependent methyltransferase
MELRFARSESTFDYFAATESYLRRYGKPVAFYSDKLSVFRVTAKEAVGGIGYTQFGRAMRDLNIDIICANTPAAKGRVERAHQTLQDRLVKELRLREISDRDTGARAPKSPRDAHRPLLPHDLRRGLRLFVRVDDVSCGGSAMTTQRDDDETRTQVRAAYAKVADGQDGCAVGCCGGRNGGSRSVGYSEAELDELPAGADLGLACGNPHAVASLRAGNTVIDLGSGAGFDCFLAAKRVGPAGRVIGVDMTPEMVVKARANATRVGVTNVDFRLGEIEHLPCADAVADVVLSNCVVNLSPDKAAVFSEALRVLKPGGRLAIADVVATQAISPELRQQLSAAASCATHVEPVARVQKLLKDAGFDEVHVDLRPESRSFIQQCMPGAEDSMTSAIISARKPGASQACCSSTCCESEAVET